MSYATMGNAEILQIADAVSREKGISKESVLDAMEQAIQIAGRRKYGHEQNIKAEINPKTGEIHLFRLREVVENPEDFALQTTVDVAKKNHPDVKIGDIVKDPLPPIDFGRIAAQTAKQVIVQKVRDAERDVQFEEYKDRVGEVIHGTVKRVEYGNVTVDLGRTEATLRKDQIIPRENFKQNDRVRAYIYDVRREKSGPQIFLSRTHPGFMAKLFAQEVPEIYDGVIEIKAVARDPGSRAKIAVVSRDSGIDPIGSCVGVRGSRVQAVVNELQGEKVDIIPWSHDTATFVINALTPADATKVVIDEAAHRIEVVVPEEQLSLAIGRRGQNARLASQLVGWNIDVMTEEEESKRRAEEFKFSSELFIEALDVEEVIAQLLVAEGFTSIEEIAGVELRELASIEGFDEDVAAELQRRASEFLERKVKEEESKLKELGVEDALLELDGITSKIAIALGEKGVKTLDDLGDLATDEFSELVPDSGLTQHQVQELIMAARAHWFEDESKAQNG
ncbi:MAG: transcription termination/antitermination protein NusA [Alphaproteobacteria bacterium]|nr:transcription termination/antitermination protein NusA [Alphaproteobacteria bacterium]